MSKDNAEIGKMFARQRAVYGDSLSGSFYSQDSLFAYQKTKHWLEATMSSQDSDATEKSNRDKSKRGLGKIITNFADTTSMQGVPNINIAKHWFPKSIWTLLLLASIVVMTLHLKLLFDTYYSWPKHSRVSLGFNTLEFPAITICNVNPMRKSQLYLASPALQNIVEIVKPENIVKKLQEQKDSNRVRRDTKQKRTTTPASKRNKVKKIIQKIFGKNKAGSKKGKQTTSKSSKKNNKDTTTISTPTTTTTQQTDVITPKTSGLDVISINVGNVKPQRQTSVTDDEIVTKPTKPTVVTEPTKSQIVTKPTLPQIVTKPTVPQIVTKPTVPQIVTKPTKPTVVTEPTKSQIVTKPTLPQIVTKPTVPQIVTKPTVPQIVTKPTKPTVVTEPTKSQIATKPTLPQIVTKPTVPQIVTKPTVPQIVTKPTVPQIVTKPTVSEIVTKPTLPQIVTKPTVSQTVTKTSKPQTVTTPTVPQTVTTPAKQTTSKGSSKPKDSKGKLGTTSAQKIQFQKVEATNALTFINELDFGFTNTREMVAFELRNEIEDETALALPQQSVMSKIITEFQYLFSQESRSTRIKMGHQLEDMLVDCSFSGRVCHPQNFSLRATTGVGNCFTLQHSGLIAQTSGSNNGMTLIIYLEDDEYISGLTSGSGGQIVIHGRESCPFPNNDGIAIASGSESNIGLRLVNVNRLGPPHGVCEEGEEFKEKYGYKYTRQACHVFCLQNLISSKCQCYDEDEEELNIIAKIAEKYPPCRNMTEIRCLLRTQADYKKGKLKCQCDNPCRETRYEYSLSSRQWPSDDYAKLLVAALCAEKSPEICDKLKNMEARRLAQNFIKLNIYYEDLNYENITEEEDYEMSQFISDVGGTIGLWVGLSILSMFEVVELVFRLLEFVTFSMWCRSANRDNESKLQRPYKSGSNKY